MQPKLLLRIAAVLMLLHTIGHTMGALGSGAPPNPRIGLVIRGMETEHFNFMGRVTTLAQFYNGYGIIMIFVLLLISIQLWLLSCTVNRGMLLLMGVFLLVMAVCEFIYFFPLAALFSLLSGAAILYAYSNAKVTS